MYTTGFMQCCCLGEVAFRGNNPYSSNSWLLFYSNITHDNSQSSSDREFAPASPRALFLIRFLYWGLHNNFLFCFMLFGVFFLPKHKHSERKKKAEAELSTKENNRQQITIFLTINCETGSGITGSVPSTPVKYSSI